MKTHIETVGVHDIDAKGQDKLRFMRYPCYAEPKYDGELAWAITTDGKPRLVNKYGKGRTECPITEQLPDNVILWGELYFGDGRNGAVYDLLSNKESDGLRLMVFDILQHGTEVVGDMTYIQRRQLLTTLFPMPTTHIRLADSLLCADDKDVHNAFDMATKNGYEGIMVKPNTSLRAIGADWVKLKQTATADLKVLFIDPFLERMDVEVPFDGGFRKCGVKLPNRYKKNVEAGDVVEIKHYGILSGGGLRHPSYVRTREKGKRVSIE